MAGIAVIALFLSILSVCCDQTGAESQLSQLATERQISPGVLNCDSASGLKHELCKAVLRRVNAELKAAGIAIDKNGALFTYDNPQHEKINTGHSCSVRAEIRHRHASAFISSRTSLNIAGNSLSRPLTIGLKLPVAFSARVDARKRFGKRFFGKCHRVGRDSFNLKASLSTIADVALGFSLNPSIRTLPNGDFALTLRPVVAVMFGLENTKLRFRISGVSPFTAIWTNIAGFSSTLGSSLESLFRGRSAKKILKDIARSVAWDFGAPIVLGVGALPRPLEKLILDALGNFISREAEKRAGGFGKGLEEDLNAKIRRALKIGASGSKVIIIKKNFVELLSAAGVDADIYVRPPPVRPRPRAPIYRCRNCKIP